MVTIGIDPHKQTHTAVAVNQLGVEVATSDGTRAADGKRASSWNGLAPSILSGCG